MNGVGRRTRIDPTVNHAVQIVESSKGANGINCARPTPVGEDVGGDSITSARGPDATTGSDVQASQPRRRDQRHLIQRSTNGANNCTRGGLRIATRATRKNRRLTGSILNISHTVAVARTRAATDGRRRTARTLAHQSWL